MAFRHGSWPVLSGELKEPRQDTQRSKRQKRVEELNGKHDFANSWFLQEDLRSIPQRYPDHQYDPRRWQAEVMITVDSNGWPARAEEYNPDTLAHKNKEAKRLAHSGMIPGEKNRNMYRWTSGIRPGEDADA
jgi:hypothetical protein